MSKPRILLVDDSEQNRYVLGRILRHAGLEVLDSATGTKALEMAMDNPDLIILDVKLPDISGYEVCRRLKSNPATRTVPILQISASFVTSENKVMALEGGADGYITHPVDPTVLIATVRALLRLKQVEVLMRQSAEQWQSTFDALCEGVALLDSSRRVLRCNHAFAGLCRLDFTDIIGSDGLELLRQRLGFSADIRAESRYTCDWQHNGRWLHIGIDRVKDDGWVVVLTDITERKMAEESVRSTEKLAATGRLAHTIAHEINNPLEAVTNLIYLAQHYSESFQVKELLAQAMDELARVARITKQVLSFNRDSSRPIELDLRELLESVISLYSRQMEDKEIQLNYERSTPDHIMVCGFPGELRQVLANLLNNAIDASTSGGRINLRIRRQKLRGVAGARVTIGDSGPGIPRDIRKQIFEPFFTTKDLKGSGIGLWVTKTIISKYRGSLRFRTSTTPGRSGTCFSLFLPLSSLSPASVREQEVSQSGRMAS